MCALSIVDMIYRWRIDENVKRIEKKLSNELFVTDLIYCPLKYRYQKIYKELTIASAVNPVTILGEFSHYGIEKFIVETLGQDNVKIEVKCEREIEVDGVTYIVSGRIDAIVGDYIVEVKTSKSDASIPQSHHVLQTRLYLWLAGFRNALLLYITPNRISEYIIDKPATEGEVSDLIRSTVSGSPAPRYVWECSYCVYSALCPNRRHSSGI